MIATDYNSVGQFDDGYMEEEEEWEREGLLDPAWEKQQKKVGHRQRSRIQHRHGIRFCQFDHQHRTKHPSAHSIL